MTKRVNSIATKLAMFTILLAIGGLVQSQEIRPPFMQQEVKTVKTLDFNGDYAEEIGMFTSIGNRVFKPKGNGPFPAVVLSHTSGGLQKQHMRVQAKNLLENGYVVLMPDSHSRQGGVVINFGMIDFGIIDAYAALDFLRKQPYVDKSKIYQAGFSWGAFVSTLLASKSSSVLSNSGQRFRATVAFYSSCSRVRSNNFKVVLEDSDIPSLMLMAGKDIQTPVGNCPEILENFNKNGARFEWHVYQDATHGWDQNDTRSIGNYYDSSITKDSADRMIKFFRKNSE